MRAAQLRKRPRHFKNLVEAVKTEGEDRSGLRALCQPGLEPLLQGREVGYGLVTRPRLVAQVQRLQAVLERPKMSAKTWSVKVKEGIVLSALRGETSVAEAARQRDVHESLIQDENPAARGPSVLADFHPEIHTWKATFLEGGRVRLAGRLELTGRGADSLT